MVSGFLPRRFGVNSSRLLTMISSAAYSGTRPEAELGTVSFLFSEFGQ
jgi:hypothetical protein